MSEISGERETEKKAASCEENKDLFKLLCAIAFPPLQPPKVVLLRRESFQSFFSRQLLHFFQFAGRNFYSLSHSNPLLPPPFWLLFLKHLIKQKKLSFLLRRNFLARLIRRREKKASERNFFMFFFCFFFSFAGREGKFQLSPANAIRSPHKARESMNSLFFPHLGLGT